MRRISLVLTFFVIGVGTAQAQSDPKKWDFSGNVGLFEARPSERPGAYRDDWYAGVRYAATIGHYWTEHLKTEAAYAITSEGSHHLERFNGTPGTTGLVPYSVESIHRIEQGSVQMVWQFSDNQWVHPYVSGGLLIERDRQRVRTPAIYQYPAGRTTGPTIFVPEDTTPPETNYRVGVSAGAGAKIYMTQHAFFNAGALITYAKPVSTISLLAGFGMDF